MITTSYFAKYKGSDGVSIARITPAWIKDLSQYKDLAPSFELLRKYKNDGDEDSYTLEYLKQLNRLDVDKVYKDLDGKVLLCYERSNSFCHRHIVSRWFRDNGYQAFELE